MKSKTILPFLLTVILSLTLVNAAANFTISTSPSSLAYLTKSNIQTSFSITPNIPTGQNNVNIIVTLPQKISDGKNEITINPILGSYTFNFNNVSNGQVQGPIVLSSGTVPSNFLIGKFSANIIINATDVSNPINTLSQTVPINFINDFCKYGENGTDLSITDVQVSNNDGDDNEWSPLDEITVDVEVTNNGAEKISGVYVELGLYNAQGKNIVNDLDSLANKKIKLTSIGDGDDKKTSFTFRVPVDFEDANYKLVIKAYKDEKILCVSQSSSLSDVYYESITGARETDETKQLIVNNIIINPSPAQCGDKVQISGNVVNIGDTDYEDQVKVTLYNKDLGINLEQVIRKDFDQGDSSSFPNDFEFDVPSSMAEKSYDLEFRVWYDYDTDDETYGVGSDKIIKPIVIQGNCKTTATETTNARITAKLDAETPEAIAGKQLIINANLKNTGTVETAYTLSVSGNTAWSSLVSITPQTVTLAPSDSRDVSIVLSLDPTAEGDKQFSVKAVYGTKTTEQPVAFSVVKFSTSGQAVIDHIKANWFIYLIVLINIILIIAIIVVIRRMLAPRREEYQ